MLNFIVFEGICGTGKTTAATELCKKSNFTYSKGGLITPALVKLSNALDYNFSDALYISDLIFKTNQLRKLKSAKTVIQDKYGDSIIAFSNACCKIIGDNGYTINNQVKYLTENNILLKPNLYFYFYADKKIIIDRIKQTNSKVHSFYLKNDHMIDIVLDEFSKLIEVRQQHNEKIIKICTDNLSSNSVLALIQSEIIKYYE